MSNNDIALSSNDTEKLSIDLDNLYSDIEKSLFDMSDLVAGLSSALTGEVSDAIISKFSEFEDVFPVVGNNLKSYIQDFKNLVTSFEGQDDTTQTNDVTVQKGGGDIINVKI